MIAGGFVRRCIAAALPVLFAAACAPGLMELPEGPGVAADDLPQVVAQATAACRAVDSIVAEGAVSGSAGGQRVRGRLHLGVAEPASTRLEAIAPFGQPIFVFVSRDGRATLVLSRPDRVLEHDDPAAVLETITGVPLDPADMLDTLTGCAEMPVVDGRRLGGDWRLAMSGTAAFYFHRESETEPWRLVARVARETGRPEWRVEYREFAGGFPQELRFADADRRDLDLHIALSQVERGLPLGPEVFEVRIPPAALPVTLEELRRDGPLGADDDR